MLALIITLSSRKESQSREVDLDFDFDCICCTGALGPVNAIAFSEVETMVATRSGTDDDNILIFEIMILPSN